MKKIINVLVSLAVYAIVFAIGGALLAMVTMPDRILQYSYAGGLCGIAYWLISLIPAGNNRPD